MNDTTPPAGQPQPPFGAGFFTWIRGLGISRGGQRWFAGVASGIAERANIDPIIVRGIFVVLALLGGPGVLLYLAGWLLLPDIGGRVHLEEVFRGRAGTAAVVAAVAVGALVVIPILFRVLGFTIFGSWSLWDSLGVPDWISTTLIVFAWITAMCAITYFAWQLFLKHGRNVGRASGAASADGADGAGGAAQHSGVGSVDQPQPSPAASANAASYSTAQPSGQPTGQPTGQSAEQPTTKIDDFAQRITDGANRVNEQATQWGEKANQWGEKVGKQADDWSARYAEHHDARKLGAGHTVITLALALLAAGGAAVWALSSNAATPLLVTASLLGATAVLAVSLIIAGIRGRHTGWVGFLAFCGVIALVATSVLPWGSRFQPFGNLDIVPNQSALLLAGNSYTDLTSLDLTRTSEEMAVWNLFGNAHITLPESAPVVVKVYLLAGNISGQQSTPRGLTEEYTKVSGPFLSRTFETHPGSTRATEVSVFMLGGNVEVTNPSTVRRSLEQLTRDQERTDLENEILVLRQEEDALRYDLSQPGLSETRSELLENRLEFTRDEISNLEKELVR